MAAEYDIAVIGAGSIGISVAYHALLMDPKLSVVLIDAEQPMSLTSAASGENYRNWWPHPHMKSLMDRSIDILETMNRQAEGGLIVSNRGYLLASREPVSGHMFENLQKTFVGAEEVRVHTHLDSYKSALQTYDGGVDIVTGGPVVSALYTRMSPEIQSLVHIRRGGTMDVQHLGQTMLERFRTYLGHRILGQVVAIEQASRFKLSIKSMTGEQAVLAERVVNAAGPFAGHIAQMVGADLPLVNTMQQKVAFNDIHGVIDREQPFSIDLDVAVLDWSTEEIGLLQDDEQLRRFLEPMPGAIHCRADGPRNGQRIKIGWAYNDAPAIPSRTPEIDPVFPEIAVRGACRLHPELKHYIQHRPGQSHYGGYYTMTIENWPLLGATPVADFYVACGFSGYGSMAACAAGELMACHLCDRPLTSWGRAMSLDRYRDHALMAEINELGDRGLL